MVDRAELFSVADQMVAEGRNPSQRLVRARLSRRGSFRDVSKLLGEWKGIRPPRPQTTKVIFPLHLRNRLIDIAAEIWADGFRQGTAAGRGRAPEPGERRDVEELGRGKEVLARDPALRRSRRGAKKFWAEVMREIIELLGDRELTDQEIVDDLKPETHRSAPELRQRGGTALLAWKMRRLAILGRDFVEVKKYTFRRRKKDDIASASAKSLAPPQPEQPPEVARATRISRRKRRGHGPLVSGQDRVL